ncbi:MAG: riboflavin biosynthesis protein RibF [Tannerellaceae bacterium]|nr:riboflavin biosynthesis protein RibF [Tannerellaceae bacterium]
MVVIDQVEEVKEKALAVTVGFFDGVHMGHRFLIHDLRERADACGLSPAVITFRTHPRAVLHADYQPQLLNTYEEKLYQLSTIGVDYCIVLDFTPELAALPAQEFMRKVLVQQLGVKLLLVGYDHRFGNNRTDGFEQYVEYSKASGIEVIQSLPYHRDGLHISSSTIRRCLEEGKVKEANQLLTYPYQLTGHIIRGNRIGRTLGFPTANIRINDAGKVIPAAGVYGVEVLWRENRYNGMLHIGNRPTVNKGDELSVEVHIIGFEGDIYDDEITLLFKEYVRGNVRFDSLEELRQQLERDKEYITRLMETKENGTVL